MRGFLPHQLDVRDPARDVDEVERALADDLVGDVHVTASRVARLRRADGIEPPFAGDTLQLVNAAVVELDPRAGDEVLHGARDEHFTGCGRVCDASPDRNGDPGQLPVVPLALAGVEADAELQAQRAHVRNQRARALDRASWAVERGEEAVSGGVDLLSSELRDPPTDDRVMAFEQITPGSVTELRRALGRADDVREEDGRQHTVDAGERHSGSGEGRRLPE